QPRPEGRGNAELSTNPDSTAMTNDQLPMTNARSADAPVLSPSRRYRSSAVPAVPAVTDNLPQSGQSPRMRQAVAASPSAGRQRDDIAETATVQPANETPAGGPRSENSAFMEALADARAFWRPDLTESQINIIE